MELVLVRHAEPTEQARDRCYGRLDVELSDRGRAQCEQLAARLSEEPVAAVVSSPRLRARDTAAAIAERHGLTVSVLGELRELDFGELEGHTYAEIASSHPDLYARWMRAPTNIRFPGGESYADLHARVVDVVTRLRATYSGRLVVAVTHAGVVRATLAEILGMPHDRIFQLAVDTASITRLEWVEDVTIVRCFNTR